MPDSLKESTSEKRGKGVHRKVSSHARLPCNWMDFLRDLKNKKELFALLIRQLCAEIRNKDLLCILIESAYLAINGQ